MLLRAAYWLLEKIANPFYLICGCGKSVDVVVMEDVLISSTPRHETKPDMNVRVTSSANTGSLTILFVLYKLLDDFSPCFVILPVSLDRSFIFSNKQHLMIEWCSRLLFVKEQ